MRGIETDLSTIFVTNFRGQELNQNRVKFNFLTAICTLKLFKEISPESNYY